MNSIKSIMLLTAILWAYMLYAEENTYIKQQVAYKDQGANGKELTWRIHPLYPRRWPIGATSGDKDVDKYTPHRLSIQKDCHVAVLYNIAGMSFVFFVQCLFPFGLS